MSWRVSYRKIKKSMPKSIKLLITMTNLWQIFLKDKSFYTTLHFSLIFCVVLLNKLSLPVFSNCFMVYVWFQRINCVNYRPIYSILFLTLSYQLKVKLAVLIWTVSCAIFPWKILFFMTNLSAKLMWFLWGTQRITESTQATPND